MFGFNHLRSFIIEFISPTGHALHPVVNPAIEEELELIAFRRTGRCRRRGASGTKGLSVMGLQWRGAHCSLAAHPERVSHAQRGIYASHGRSGAARALARMAGAGD